MFNFNIVTPKDMREAKKIERARIFDEERKARIFNAKQRLIGVDVEALEKQIKEKKAQEEAEQAQIKAQYKKEVDNIQIMDSIERQINEQKKQMVNEINEFRKLYQKKESRREFDLNDPNFLKKSLPCRVGDDDPRISISSVQKFEGEDSAGNERKRMQAEQQRHWLLQQIVEKRKQDQLKRQSEKILLETIKARDERAREMDKLERDCRKQIELANVAFNQALAYEQETQRNLRKQMELENNIVEINNALTSDLLTENTEVSQSNLGLGKQIGALYKGMNEQQKQEFRDMQEKQRQEQRAKKEAEKAYDKYWEDFNDKLNKNIYTMDLKNKERQKEQLKLIYQENERLGKEQRAHREYLNKVVYTNTPSAAFYNQFHKTTR